MTLRRPKKAALIIGHGSKAPGFEQAMKKTARRLAALGDFDAVAMAYLEITPPAIHEAIDRLAARGMSEIRVLPYFLQMGRHVREHIPAAVAQAAAKHRGKVRVVLCPYLGYDERIVAVVIKRLAVRSRRGSDK